MKRVLALCLAGCAVASKPAPAAAPLAIDDVHEITENGAKLYNYDVSVYRLPSGTHTIEWNVATLSGDEVLSSNRLTLRVR